MKTLQEMTDERVGLVKELRELDELAVKEERSLTADETTKWENLNADIDRIGAEIRRRTKLEAIDAEGNESRNRFQPGSQGGGESRGGSAQEAELRALTDWELAGRDLAAVSDEVRSAVEAAQGRAFRSFLSRGYNALQPADFRALQMGQGTQGGYAVAPQTFVNDLIKFVDDEVFIRTMATRFTITGAHSLGYPSLETDPADADWTTELATGNEDSSMALGKREFATNPLAKRIKVSRTLMRQSNIEQLVRERLGYKFAITQEKAFLTGTGANQPLGVFTASDQGISTSRDVSADNTTTAITADGLINAKFALKGQYWAKASWIFHRDAIKNVRKLKGSDNNYLWSPGLVAGDPDRILDCPYHMSEYVPNTFTTGLYVGIIGDFSQYYIADSLDMDIQRLEELYAESNQIGFIGRGETDGMPVLEEAFARVKLG